MSDAPLVIVGASYAGMQLAVSARQASYPGPIMLVGAERHLPYQRPPLSKAFLGEDFVLTSLPLKSEAFYAANDIELLLDTRVSRIDRDRSEIETADGRRLSYNRLALTVGARSRRLSVPGADLDGVLYLRSLNDAVSFKQRLADVGSVVIVGGGFIGLEVAASLAARGIAVTIIEAQERILARVATPLLSDFVCEHHRRAGVRIFLSTTIVQLHGTDGRVRAVECGGGVVYPANLVLVGIGSVARTELAEQAGLPCSNGIVVDQFSRTADSRVYAAGDCSWYFSSALGRHVRLESVQNALEQAKIAGANAAGGDARYDAVPWFWSDQYDLKLQMVGSAHGHDRSVVRGSITEGRFSIFHFKDNALIGVDSVNRPAEHLLSRKLLSRRSQLQPEQAADEDFDLGQLVRGVGGSGES